MEGEGNTVHGERELEEDAFMQLNHKDMKKWYGENPELKAKYGRFPLFWQDLKDWENWTEVKKEYMKEKERKELKEERRQKRQNRWGDAEKPVVSTRWQNDETEVDPGLPAAIAASVISIEELQVIQFRMKMQKLTDKIEHVEEEAARIANDPNRSPSPEPIYDQKMGHRTNTRAQRMRRKLEDERSEIMDEIVKLNPILKAIQPKAHCQAKIYFPIKEYPNYNFLGLIIGPRGSTHRQLEQSTHTKIIIRGRGTGRENKSNYDLLAQDDDPHVLITGENEDDVANAVATINELLVPKDDDQNVHKQKQMRQLALLNGFHETDSRCPYCGMTGHDQFNCPNRPQDFTNEEIRCEICGDSGHIARDCPNRNDHRRIQEYKRINDEYTSFMDDLSSGRVLGSQQQQQQQQQQQMPPMQQPGMAWNPQAQQYNPYPYMQQWPQSGYTGGYPGYGY